MTKSSFLSIVFGCLMGVIVTFLGFGIMTWQFWVIIIITGLTIIPLYHLCKDN